MNFTSKQKGFTQRRMFTDSHPWGHPSLMGDHAVVLPMALQPRQSPWYKNPYWIKPRKLLRKEQRG
jgi:hypothetical protein